MNSVAISIIIPTYNRADSIVRAIDSVKIQDYEAWELIIVDDGSKDNTVETITPYLDDNRIKYYKQGNQGVSAARNFGVSKAVSDWLVFLDSDDTFLPGALTAFINGQAKQPADIYYSVLELFSPEGNTSSLVDPENPYNIKKNNTAKGVKLPGAFCLRKQLFEKAGGYDPKLAFSENTELFMRLEAIGFSHCILKEITVRMYRVESIRTSNSDKNLIESTRYILEKHPEHFNRLPHVKWIYLNILGVTLSRNNQKSMAKTFFWEAIKIKPLKWKSYARLLLTYL